MNEERRSPEELLESAIETLYNNREILGRYHTLTVLEEDKKLTVEKLVSMTRELESRWKEVGLEDEGEGGRLRGYIEMVVTNSGEDGLVEELHGRYGEYLDPERREYIEGLNKKRAKAGESQLNPKKYCR